jgi:hypothetical protein
VTDTPIDVVSTALADAGTGKVDLGALLEATERFVRRFVAFENEHQSAAVVLWTAHTYVIEAFDTTGYLHVHSAEKRSGKTRLLEVLELLVRNPIRGSTMSPSVLFRLLDQGPQTLLLDEVDAIFSPKADREELRGLLNAGYRRGSYAWRNDVRGKSFVPTPFDVFGAKILAGIGTLPDTIADRCIPIELRRRRREDVVQAFRYREAKRTAEGIKERFGVWATPETIETLAAARPRVPDLNDDRAMEAWEPLCAIADLAGGSWPQRAHAAAKALHDAPTGAEEPDGIATLRAVRELFQANVQRDRFLTVEILRALAARDDGPWAYWFADELDRLERDEKPPLKSARKLSRLLKPYGIVTVNIRPPDGGVGRGYRLEDFVDAWSRYLSHISTTSTTTATPLASAVADAGDVAVGDQTPTDAEALANIMEAFPSATVFPSPEDPDAA